MSALERVRAGGRGLERRLDAVPAEALLAGLRAAGAVSEPEAAALGPPGGSGWVRRLRALAVASGERTCGVLLALLAGLEGPPRPGPFDFYDPQRDAEPAHRSDCPCCRPEPRWTRPEEEEEEGEAKEGDEGPEEEDGGPKDDDEGPEEEEGGGDEGPEEEEGDEGPEEEEGEAKEGDEGPEEEDGGGDEGPEEEEGDEGPEGGDEGPEDEEGGGDEGTEDGDGGGEEE